MTKETESNEIMELVRQAGIKTATAPSGTVGDYLWGTTHEIAKFFRLAYARGMLKQAEQGRHWSDCAVNSEPAYPAGECDCGGFTGGDVVITRQWVGLTDEEVMKLNTVREAEKLLKEKNT
jgi:hypothetical protein